MKLILAAVSLSLLTIASGRAEVTYETVAASGIVITGIRGDVGGNVVISASSVLQDSSGDTVAALYQGPLAGSTSPTAVWHTLTPDFGPSQTVTSSSFYGPNTSLYGTGLPAGQVIAVGSYKYTQGASGPNMNHGMIYKGAVTGGGTWTQIDATSLVTGPDTLKNTIAHSNMGNLVVGNYDTEAYTGQAFIYNMAAVSPEQAWYNLNPMASNISDTTTASPASVTAYGIWQNANGTYTIAGGYSDLDNGGLDNGYLVNYNPTTGDLTNFKSYQFENQPLSALISHFDGITATEDGFNLTGDKVGAGTGGVEQGFFASVKMDPITGEFSDAVWTSIVYPESTATSGNTVYEDTVLGIYVNGDGSSSYLATVPEPSSVALLAITGLGAVLFFRRRQATTL